MKLILHLIRTSRRTVLLSILAGSLCGASTAGLVALINSILNSETPGAQTYLPAFIGLLVALIGLTVWSQVLLVQLAEGSVYELRLQLSRQILATPLRQLEELGAHRLLAVLTADIGDIGNGYLLLPPLFIQGTALIISLVYLGVLSWALLVAGLGFLVVGAFVYVALARRAQGALGLAREQQDALFQHFRGLTEGSKELKIHRSRRDAFLNDLLQGTAQTTREYTVALFKELFYTQLLADLKARGKTVLVITHNDKYFSYADRLLKLASGQLIDPALPAYERPADVTAPVLQ